MHDFETEVQNLDYIKESLTDSQRVMKHIAAIVHGNDFMIILPHADLFDLEIFLRGGCDPDPSTDQQRSIYDFDAKFPMLNTTAKMQRALIEEAYQLASALKWLHEDLKIFGAYNRYLAHMDLKPANVLIVGDARSPAGKWMLSDFGVSSFDKATNARADTPSIRDVGYRLTSLGFQDRVVRGHGPYQPPEVDLDNVDGRKCDVWSFSCVMCDVLAFAIGRTEAVYRLRNLRYDGGDDYFYRTKPLLQTKIDGSSVELKPQIVQWWEEVAKEPSFPEWAANYIMILRRALQPKPSDRPDIADIVRGLNALAPSILSQGISNLDIESKGLSSSPPMNGLASQYSLTAQHKPPSITLSHASSSEVAPPGGDHGNSSSIFLKPGSALQQEPNPPTRHEEHVIHSPSNSKDLYDSDAHASDLPSTPPEGKSSERRTSSVGITNFKERPRISVLPPKTGKVIAVAVNASPLQVAILCKDAVHLCESIDGEENLRHIDLNPRVDWKKIRLASHYFAVYGVGPSNEKSVS